MIHVPYQHSIGVWDRKGCFLEVTAICWFHRQSHSRGQEGLSLLLKDELHRHCVNNSYDPDKKRSEDGFVDPWVLSNFIRQ